MRKQIGTVKNRDTARGRMVAFFGSYRDPIRRIVRELFYHADFAAVFSRKLHGSGTDESGIEVTN